MPHGSKRSSVKSDGGLKEVEHLSAELDDLLAEMGRQLLVARSGQLCELRLASCTGRTVEIRLPKLGPDDPQERAVVLECGCSSKWHARDKSALRDGMPPEVPFQVLAGDSQPRAEKGPYRAQAEAQAKHRLCFTTDAGTVFVNLLAHQPCHVELLCRVLAGGGHGFSSAHSVAERGDAADDAGRPHGLGVGRRLQAKLEHKRDEWSPPSPSMQARAGPRRPAGRSAAGGGAAAAAPGAPSWQSLRRSFGEYIFGDTSRGVRDLDSQLEAARRVLRIWLGPGSRFYENIRRPQGTWINKVDEHFREKLIAALRKAKQDRHALTTIAVVGASAFFLKRWQELHAMRARKAMRQLVWYKVLFAASRCRVVAAVVADGREHAQAANKEEKQRRLRGQAPLQPKAAGRLVAGSVAFAACHWHHLAMKHDHQDERFLEWTRASIAKLHHRCTSLSRRPLVKVAAASGGAEEATGFELTLLQLARSGFVVRPDDVGPGAGARLAAVAEAPREQKSRERRKADLTEQLSKRLGLPVHWEPEGDPSPHEHPPHTPLSHRAALSPGRRGLLKKSPGAHLEVRHIEETGGLLQVTISPQDVPRVIEACGGSFSPMGTGRFEQFRREEQLRGAEALARRQVAEEAARAKWGNRIVYTKRYLLHFLDQPQDLPWLRRLESLMMVIHDVPTAFRNPQDQASFEDRLPSINDARRAAMLKPGVFAPLEVAMWSHPVILTLAARLQRATCRGGSATAWKGAVFEGCYGCSSDRDASGVSLKTSAPVGGYEQLVLRRLADVGGPFAVSTGGGSALETCERVVAGLPTCLATRTANGYQFRNFGDPNPVSDNIVRFSDKLQELGLSATPRDVRIERHYQGHRLKLSTASLPRQDSVERLLLHAELKAEQRYKGHMLGSSVPLSQLKFKEQLLPAFDKLMADMKLLPAVDKLMAETSLQISASASTLPPASDLPRVPSWESLHDQASPWSPRSSKDSSAAAGPVGRGAAGAPPAPPGGSVALPPLAAIPARGGKAAPSAASPKAASARGGRCVELPPAAPPQTLEEIGKLVAQCDALKSIMSIDQAETGGFARRCLVGWSSGYREEPMTKEELRRTRQLEKRQHPVPHLRGRAGRSGTVGAGSGFYSAR